MLLKLGATDFIDRNADVLAEVAKITSKPIDLVYDTVSLPSTQRVGWEVVSKKGHLILVLSPVVDQQKYKDKKIVVPRGNVHYDDNSELGRAMYSRLTGWLKDGLIVVSDFFFHCCCGFSMLIFGTSSQIEWRFSPTDCWG